ncbi:hypothetical protein [Nocardia tengchongensis]|uniref:hypothetical protein n=1 Tax=Nocardia tengchongensis TaxID=2055889 RepID=UPI003689B476
MTREAVRRIGWVATTMALAATIATVAAPVGTSAPSSTFQGVWVLDDSGYAPAHISVGVRYVLHADAVGQTPRVNFYDNSACLGSTLAKVFRDPVSDDYAWVYWVPTSTGTHVLSTKQGDWENGPATVQVEAAPAGSTPVTQPKLDGCGGGGSLDLSNYPIGYGSSTATP